MLVHQLLGHVSLGTKTYITKISVKGGGLVISIFFFPLYFLLLPQNNALSSTYLLQLSLFILRTFNHFVNSLLQYANFFKIRQKNANSFLYIVYLADFEEFFLNIVHRRLESHFIFWSLPLFY